ncbi:unnamed protein product [Hymenolepis diminuta]|uniref:Uncharacterized protein n=1 Tax=Hymenolepis diminuta TaxID=6216 RepID=A0A564Z2K6_HYMDI|nr:unnamed protein product [Hymenolepis diminuta]
MIFTEAQLIQRCLGTSPVRTISSSSYNPSIQLKHTRNYVPTRALIQLTNINSLLIHTYINCCLSDTSSFAPFLKPLDPFECLYAVR